MHATRHSGQTWQACTARVGQCWRVTRASYSFHASSLWVQVLLNKVIGPYTCVRMSFLAKKVNCSEKEVERLLALLIVDGRIDGHLDQVKQLLLLSPGGSQGEVGCKGVRPTAINKWVATLTSMQQSLLQKGSI
jgi:hypothetical protein